MSTPPMGSSVPGDTETTATGGIVSGPAAIGEDGCTFVVPAEHEHSWMATWDEGWVCSVCREKPTDDLDMLDPMRLAARLRERTRALRLAEQQRDHAIHERVTSNAAAVHMLRMVAERTADYTPEGMAMRLRAEADRLEARETTEAVR